MRIITVIIFGIIIAALLVLGALCWMGSRAVAGKDSKLTNAIGSGMARVVAWAKSGNKAEAAA